MKRSLIILISILSIIVGCFLHKQQYDVVRKTPKLKYETPFGCVWLHDNIFIDKSEVRNLDYLEFLYWTSRKEPEKLKAILPDTSVWKDSLRLNEPYVLYYLRHPSYRDYPVVGISYEQAIAFCNWRSDRVNEFIYLRDHKIKNKDYKIDSTYPHPEKMHYRLPTKQEWEYASSAGLPYCYFPLGYESLVDKNHIPVSNTLEVQRFIYDKKMNEYHTYVNGGIAGSLNDFADVTIPVYTGEKNKYGINNLLGNVSEIIADTLFKGLNYETALDGSTFKLKKQDYQKVDSTSNGYDYKYTFRYQKPQAWLGFRCVCEVKKEMGK